MLYAATTFWLLVIVFSAWGVHALWSRLVKPRAVNVVLLPGTLVAQLGHVLGILVTGGAVQNTTLMSDGEDGAPRADTPEKTRIPIVGSIIVGLLPLLACAGALYAAAHYWGGDVIGGADLDGPSVPQALPTSVAEAWQLLHDGVNVMQDMTAAIAAANLRDWSTLLFLYLAVCLTVRMTPFEGNRRGAIGAILLAGGVIWLAGSLSAALHDGILASWPLLSFSVGMLLFLLLVSLLVTGGVGFARILMKEE